MSQQKNVEKKRLVGAMQSSVRKFTVAVTSWTQVRVWLRVTESRILLASTFVVGCLTQLCSVPLEFRAQHQCSLEIAAPMAGGMATPTDNPVSSFLLPSRAFPFLVLSLLPFLISFPPFRHSFLLFLVLPLPLQPCRQSASWPSLSLCTDQEK